MMRSESTSALGQPRLTKPTAGARSARSWALRARRVTGALLRAVWVAGGMGEGGRGAPCPVQWVDHSNIGSLHTVPAAGPQAHAIVRSLLLPALLPQPAHGRDFA